MLKISSKLRLLMRIEAHATGKRNMKKVLIFLMLPFVFFLFYSSLAWSEELDNQGEAQIFIPFKEKESEATTTKDKKKTESATLPVKDKFAGIQSYKIKVMLGYSEKAGSETSGFVIVNKTSSEPIALPKNRLSVNVKQVKGGALVDIQGISSNDKALEVMGYEKELKRLTDVIPGEESFMMYFDMDVGKDVIVYVDLATNTMKTIKKVKVKESEDVVPPKNEVLPEIPITMESSEEYRNFSKNKDVLSFLVNIKGYPEIADIFENGDFLYLVTGTNETLEILDVHDPHSIQRVKYFNAKLTPREVNLLKGRAWYSEWSKVRVINNTAYILNRGYGVKDDLLLVDISDKSSPKLLAVFDTYSQPEDLEVRDNFIYLVTQKDFQIVDASSPKKLKLVGSYSFKREKDSDVFSMAIGKDFAYISGYKIGPLILDISSPENISLVNSIATKNLPIALKIYNNYLFVSEINPQSGMDSQVSIYDVNDKSSLKQINAIKLNNNDGARNLFVKDNRLYMAIIPLPMNAPKKSTYDSLQVYDVQNISEPKLIDGYAVEKGCPALTVFVESKYVFLPTACGLIVLNTK